MRGFLITLLVLVVVLVGADFAVRWVVENQVETRVQQAQKLSEPPSISASGFPFVTQFLSGQYPSVHYRLDGVSYGSLDDVRVDADLTDVRVPFEDLTGGSIDSIPAQRVEASVSLDPSELARLLRVQDVSVEPVTEADLDARRAASDEARTELEGVDPGEAVELTTTQSVGGISGTATAIATYRISGGRISLSAEDVQIDAGLPDALTSIVERAVSSRLSRLGGTIDPGQLPFDLTVDGIRAEDGRLVVTGSATDVDLLDAAQ